MQRVVVGAGRTPEGAAALRYAAEQVEGAESYLHVVHAIDPEERADLGMEADLVVARRASRDRMQAWALRVLEGHLDRDASVLVSTLDGPVLDTLLEEGRGAHVVVIGLPRDGRHVHLVEDLVARCSCPVVVVDAEGSATEVTPV